jgi:Ca2+-transporting ATPase
VERYWWVHVSYDRFGLIATAFSVVKLLLPFFVLFYGFSMFYKFAPRRRTALSEVWLAAFFVALALQGLQSLFVWYAANVAKFNKVYGTFGGAVALLMWIYLSGSVIIIGGCLCAAQAAVSGKLALEEAESP